MAVLREQNRNNTAGIQVEISGLEKLRKQKENNKDKKPSCKYIRN